MDALPRCKGMTRDRVRLRLRGPLFIYAVLSLVAWPVGSVKAAGHPASDRKAEYVKAVTRGVGLLPWQTRMPSKQELHFREHIERRKDDLLASRQAVVHPAMMSREEIARARQNIESAAWAKAWVDEVREIADHVVNQPDDYVKHMIPELTPTNTYGFTCPNCVGRQSQEGAGTRILNWDYRNPDVCSCKQCGHVYPSEEYPESARLECPRTGQTFTFYLNKQQQADPQDRSGRLAWHWVGRPIHVSFSGNIRRAKVAFMVRAVRATALQYVLTDDPRYAARAITILDRLAHCYRNWLYRDYWDTIADCDPMYAAWHDKKLPLEYKRHLCEEAYAQDSEQSAAMLRDYWGAGRMHPSTDAITSLTELAKAYDLVHDATDKAGVSLWKPETRERVERDLLLEYLMGAEPFVGGEGKANDVTNKSPRVYAAMAAVGRCLGLAQYVETALRGYEGVRDQSFVYDGFSKESPAYTDMYLTELMLIPELLNGFSWGGYSGRSEAIDLFARDSQLRMMFRAMRDQLQPDGRYTPLADTSYAQGPNRYLVEMGVKYYPEYYAGILPALKRVPSPYAVLNLNDEAVRRDDGFRLPEIYFPAWMTGFLRHGQGPAAAMVALTFSPAGGHRHLDNLALLYVDGGHTLLGDLGYVGDMPVNNWNRSTFSHNLVIVDDKEQSRKRSPRFVRMFTSPRVSVIEAASDAYQQCREYSRLVAMLKGPGGQTFAVDVFRVEGGRNHTYRVFSELASSDVPEGRMEFHGLRMPAEPPLPQVGVSLAAEDIFGLRDVRGVDHPPAGFEAAWVQKDRSYRLWMRAQADRVEASNGPGQKSIAQAGRRVRYLDVIRQGEALKSTFVAVHEPSGNLPDAPIISRVELLDVAPQSGPDALALLIESSWGRYVLLNRFEGISVTSLPWGSVRFQGDLAVMHEEGGRFWSITQGAGTFIYGGKGFEDATPVWSGKVSRYTADTIETPTPKPADWQATPADVQQYVRVKTREYETGFVVKSTSEKSLQVDRFPLPDAGEFSLPSVRVITGQEVSDVHK